MKRITAIVLATLVYLMAILCTLNNVAEAVAFKAIKVTLNVT